jgi:hypothetical protein
MGRSQPFIFMAMLEEVPRIGNLTAHVAVSLPLLYLRYHHPQRMLTSQQVRPLLPVESPIVGSDPMMKFPQKRCKSPIVPSKTKTHAQPHEIAWTLHHC